MLVARDPAAVRAGDLPAPPLISIEPFCNNAAIEGSFPVTFTFRLRNFTPNSEVTVQFGNFEPLQQQLVTVGAYGSLDQQLTFNFGSNSDVPITAFETANPRIAASTALRVPCTPTVRLTPNCDAPADPVAARNLSILAEGANWDPFSGPVELTLAQRSGDGQISISSTVVVTPTEQLTFSTAIDLANPGSDDVFSPLMALPAGDYFVMAVQPRTQIRVDVDFAVPCATVTLTPTCGDAGAPLDIYDLLVTGSGFRPFVQAQVIFDAFGQPQVFQLDVGATGQLLIGDIEEARIKPFRHPDGLYVVVVRQGPPENIVREAAATFTVPCPPTPDVFIEPLCGPPQLLGDDPRTIDLRLTGVNLVPGVLTISVDPEARGGVPEVLQLTVGASVDAVVTIARRPSGQYQIVVSEEGQPLVKTFAFDVPCAPADPRVRLRCDPEETNQPELSELVLEARGFYPDAPLELLFGGVAETVRTDTEGRFSRRVPAANLAPGPFSVTATQRDAFSVVAEATRSIVLPCGTREPTLLISPPQGSPGLVVMVRGFNLRPNSTLSLRWSRGIGSTRTIDVTTDADGLFEKQVLLFHHDFAGVRELAVESSNDPLAVGLTVDFVVAPGSGSPPAFTGAGLEGFPPIVFRR